MQNLIELDFIWEVSQALSCNVNSAEILKSLQVIFNKYLKVDCVNVVFYNAEQQIFSDFGVSNAEFSKEKEDRYKLIFDKLNSTIRLNFILNDQFFVINDDFHLEYRLKLNQGENKFYIPLMQNYKCIGFLELIQNNNEQESITKDMIKVLFIISSEVAGIVTNKKLNDKIIKIADFYKAQKNIAKILETQYEYSFLIPVIGEILDNFAKDYFAYIFMKNEKGGFDIAWPLRYDKKRIKPMLENVSLKNKITVKEDGTAVLFPIYFENVLQGAIIIDGKNKKILKEDMEFIMQLSVQTATTLDKAGVYAEIEKYATQDALTGLNNRRSLDLRIAQEVAIAKRKNLPLCAMMLDVDFFKKINDTYGHYVGDIILKEFGRIINDEVREYDFAARYGGEEFFIILPSTTIDEAKVVANRLRARIEAEEFNISKFNDSIKSLNVTTSIGLAKLSEEMDLKQLFVKVDKALYEAKKTGRNRVVVQ